MSGLSATQQDALKGTFAARVNFDPVERKIYSHDVAAMPSLIKPIVGATTADAVVQPGSEAEIVGLVRWANENNIALVPRGKASSGYGGVIPRKRGVVVDFYRFKSILAVDKGAQTVTVQSGIVWEALDSEIKKQGLTLRLFPSSYPGSTVGGWLAQGGAGFGSFQYGFFSDNVMSAKVVLPTGEVRTFSGADLDLISEAEGITGIITEITLKVQTDFEPALAAIGCHDPAMLAKGMQALVDSKLPIWSVTFVNPKMATMKNAVPLKTHHDHVIEERVDLPPDYIVTLAYRPEDEEKITAGLKPIVAACNADILSHEIAEHEWSQRFRLMRVKRLGPSIIPTEIIVPLAKLGDMISDTEKAIASQHQLVKEGVIIPNGKNGPEAVILGFIPHDQRTLGFNFAFPLSLSVIKIAEKHGGRAYATGMYFTGRADTVLGAERVARLRQFKRSVDPRGLMNPGKVIDSGLLGATMSLASAFEPLLRPIGNMALNGHGERIPDKPVKGIPPDVAWYAYACSQCGYCVDACDQFYGRGWESHSPRGKWFWLREYMEGRAKLDQDQLNRFLLCTTCELCNDRCSEFLPIEPSWMKLRGKYINDDNKLTFPAFEMMKAALKAEGDVWAGYRKDRSTWMPEEMKAKHGPEHPAKMAYFAGCTASYVENDIAIGTVKLLDAAGVDFTTLGNQENCCGIPMLVSGKWDAWEANMRRNIAKYSAAGVDTIVTSCPACWMVWDVLYRQWAEKLGIEYTFKTKHYSEVLADKIKSGELKFTHPVNARVTWHDSCHIGRAGGIYEPPRDLIKAIPGVEFVEMEHNREKGLCCGSVLSLVGEAPVAADIGEHRLQEAVDIKADAVLALCPCCQVQLRITNDKKKMNMPVWDLARFAAQGLGITDIKDTTNVALEQWAVFDAFIKLMTPQGFAGLMGSMWPEMIDAMPFKMGPMMRFMGKLPGPLSNGMFAMMKPMFPLLFPILLPMMMPKVLPPMLERVNQTVPFMPDYMRQQMPSLMPPVMDALMPKMLPDVVPLVIDPMVRYLQGK